MLYGLVYTPRQQLGARDSSPDLFVDWYPPLPFVHHWRFASGGGIGLVEASGSCGLEKAVAPYRQFYDFTLALIEPDGPEPDPAVERVLAAVA